MRSSDNRLQRLSTRTLPASQRFEFWRHVHNFIDIDAVEKERRRDFRGDLLLYLADDGSTFGCVSNDDVVTRFARTDDDYVLLSICLSGAARIETGDQSTRMVTPASGLVLMDGGQQATVTTDRHSHVYLTIPKVRLTATWDGQAALLRASLCRLPSIGLAPLLMSHLVSTANQAERLSEQSMAVAIKAAIDLAVGTLAQAQAGRDALFDEGHDDALYAAAQRYIQIHLGAPGLTAVRIARALGCSRAHLYRVFASHDQGIGEVIRARRLDQASAMLASSVGGSIEQIAATCGFANASAFSRTFRDRKGMTPTAFRDQARSL